MLILDLLIVTSRGGWIQKFAMRFPSIYEAESFIDVLKEILKGDKNPEPLNTDFGSEISSQSEFMSTNEHSYSRACEELSFMTPVDNYIPQLPLFVNNEVGQPSESEAKGTTPSHNFEGMLPALPPSFSSLLMDCSQNKHEQPTVSEEIELKSQIVRYMEDSSFQVVHSRELKMTNWHLSISPRLLHLKHETFTAYFPTNVQRTSFFTVRLNFFLVSFVGQQNSNVRRKAMHDTSVFR
ncbi:hypothetical protein ACSQ67_005988 [Phaseolus vulgaris]